MSLYHQLIAKARKPYKDYYALIGISLTLQKTNRFLKAFRIINKKPCVIDIIELEENTDGRV